MSNPIEEAMARFLGRRPFTCIYYSEPERQPALNGELRQGVVRREAFGPNPFVQVMASRGLVPVILVSYDYLFKQSLQGKDLQAFIATHWDPSPAFNMNVYFVSATKAKEMQKAIERHVGGTNRCHENSQNGSTVWHAPVGRFEKLRLIYIGKVPVQGDRGAA